MFAAALALVAATAEPGGSATAALGVGATVVEPCRFGGEPGRGPAVSCGRQVSYTLYVERRAPQGTAERDNVPESRVLADRVLTITF